MININEEHTREYLPTNEFINIGVWGKIKDYVYYESIVPIIQGLIVSDLDNEIIELIRKYWVLRMYHKLIIDNSLQFKNEGLTKASGNNFTVQSKEEFYLKREQNQLLIDATFNELIEMIEEDYPEWKYKLKIKSFNGWYFGDDKKKCDRDEFI